MSALVTETDFINASSTGTLLFIQELYNINPISDNNTLNSCFTIAGSRNAMDICQWIYSLSGFQYNNAQSLFQNLCSRQYNTLAEWIFTTYSLDPIFNFQLVCISDNLPLAQFIYGLGNLSNDDIINITNIIYLDLFSGGILDILQYLNSLSAFPLLTQSNGFVYACKNNQLLTAQWLYGLGNINIDNYRAIILITPYVTPTVTWLNSLL